MFEWLSVPARKVIVEAHAVARMAGRSTISTGDLVAGFLSVEDAVAGDVLRRHADGGALEIAARASVEADEPDELLRMVLCAGVGVAAARGTRHIGSSALLLGLIALEPPSLTMLCAAVGTDPVDLSASCRATDDSSELDLPTGGGDWIITVADGDEAETWPDPLN